MSYSPSYWESDTFLRPYDLIIVGAGIVGLMSALFYKREHPHSRIAILERGLLPRGASTRNAGFACVGSITEHVADLEKESEDNIRMRIRRRYDGLQMLRKTLGDDAIGYEACGGYELFTSEEQFESASLHIDKFNDWMSELISQDKVYKADRLNGYPVIHNRLEGALHPGRMMQELILLVKQQGVDIIWSATVSHVGNGNVVLADGDELNASKVLIAANGFTQQLLPDVEVQPARGFVFVTKELPKLLWRGTFHHDRGYIYFRNIGDRLLLGGARNLAKEEETTDQFGINPKIKENLVHFADEILKLSPGWEIDYEWSGIMGFTSTKTPVVKKLDKHRYVAAGLSGMGIAIGTEIGKMAADLLANSE